MYLQIKMKLSNRDNLRFISDCWVTAGSNTNITIPAISCMIAGERSRLEPL
jgi:hypothetical protein